MSLAVINCMLSVCIAKINSSIFLVPLNLYTLHCSTTIILLNLTARDCLTEILAQFLYTSFLALQLQSHTFCSLAQEMSILSNVLIVASFTIFLVATTKRFLSIFHPYIHENAIETWKSNMVIIFVWVFSDDMTILNAKLCTPSETTPRQLLITNLFEFVFCLRFG